MVVYLYLTCALVSVSVAVELVRTLSLIIMAEARKVLKELQLNHSCGEADSLQTAPTGQSGRLPPLEEYFTRQSSLQQQMDTRRVQCQSVPWEEFKCTKPMCGATYATKQGLKRHLDNYRGVQFICTLCGQARKRMDYLKIHFQKDHPKVALDEYKKHVQIVSPNNKDTVMA